MIQASMTARERYQAIMRFQPADRGFNFEWGPWNATISRWKKETGLDEAAVLSFLQECDPLCRPNVDFSMIPPFEERVVGEDEETITKVDKMGVTYREFKKNPDTSMPEFIGAPVKCPADWDNIKYRFDPSSPGRFPADWQQNIDEWKREQPVVWFYALTSQYWGGPSLFGFVRMLFGDEQIHYAFYDYPEVVHDMMETITEFSIAMLKKTLQEAPVTIVQFFEDMCYRTGSLISPALFREFMVPRYQRITEVIRSMGVDIIFVDSDGKVDELIPLWLESGINGVFPMEQQADNDIFAYRKQYGKDLLMAGGIDKRALAQDKAAIDRELELKIPLSYEGGYIPHLDHMIPPDVSFENFSYYWKRKKELLGI